MDRGTDGVEANDDQVRGRLRRGHWGSLTEGRNKGRDDLSGRSWVPISLVLAAAAKDEGLRVGMERGGDGAVILAELGECLDRKSGG